MQEVYYIAAQKEHHAPGGVLWPDVEETHELQDAPDLVSPQGETRRFAPQRRISIPRFFCPTAYCAHGLFAPR